VSTPMTRTSRPSSMLAKPRTLMLASRCSETLLQLSTGIGLLRIGSHSLNHRGPMRSWGTKRLWWWSRAPSIPLTWGRAIASMAHNRQGVKVS
jgi:hypothetical protein